MQATSQKLDQAQSQLKRARSELRRTARECVLLKMPKRSVCAEIGVDEGKFSRQILDTIEPEKLHLIDPWMHEEGDQYQNSRYGGLGSAGQTIMDERYRRVTEQLSAEIDAGQVEVHREFSLAASAHFEARSLDWIYLDGNHSYKFVMQDLEAYYPKIKVGGFITGDDYGAEGWWDNGVQKAIDEFVTCTPSLTLELRGTQFIIEKGEAEPRQPDR